MKALGVSESDLVLTNAQRLTRELLDEMYKAGEVSEEEAEAIMGMAQPKLRSNAARPLGRLEIMTLRDIYGDV